MSWSIGIQLGSESKSEMYSEITFRTYQQCWLAPLTICHDTYWIRSISSWHLVLWVVRVLGTHRLRCVISLTRKHIVNAISTHHSVCWHSNCNPSFSCCLQLKPNGGTTYWCPLCIGHAASSLTVGRYGEHSLIHKKGAMQWNRQANKRRSISHPSVCLVTAWAGFS